MKDTKKDLGTIKKLEKHFLEENKYTSATCLHYIKELYKLKIKHLDDEKVLNSLNNLQDIIKHKLEEIRYIRNSIVGIITSIFLPLGFIVGFYGMNFKFMGNATLDTGIFSSDSGLIILSGTMLFTILVTLVTLYLLRYHVSV